VPAIDQSRRGCENCNIQNPLSTGPEGDEVVPKIPALWMQQVSPFLAFLAGSVALQLSFDRIIGSDGFFHIRQAERAPFGDMPWLPHSIFADGWVDHQLLFHTALRPFTLLPDDVTAAKIGAAVFAAVAFEAMRRLLGSLSVPSPALFALLPGALCWRFLLRMEMPRAQSLSLALLIAALWALINHRRRALFLIAWVYAWTYQVALVLLPVALLHAALGARRDGRRAFEGLAAAAAGLLAGFAIHPHSPRTLEFIHQHVVLKVLNRASLPVGGEWTVGGVMPLMVEAGGGVAACGIAVAVLWRLRDRRPDALFLTALSVCATGGAALSVKFLEYSVPLSCVALAVVVRDAIRERGLTPQRVPWALALAAGLLFSAITMRSAVLATEPPPNRLAPALAALSLQAEPGDIVYHFSWNDFPELVFHGPRFRYIAGLDPHFLALYDPELWDLYSKIERGWGRNPSEPIANRFGARWAILVLPQEGAEEMLGGDPGLRVIHQDPHAIVYRVGEPPKE
jgi:hypothetical protein